MWDPHAEPNVLQPAHKKPLCWVPHMILNLDCVSQKLFENQTQLKIRFLTQLKIRFFSGRR